MKRKLYRSNTDKIISGTAGGLAEFFGISPKIFRIIFLVTSIFPTFGAGIVLYCILWILIPVSPVNKSKSEVKKDETVIDVDAVEK